jgi:hypothetical protein
MERGHHQVLLESAMAISRVSIHFIRASLSRN